MHQLRVVAVGQVVAVTSRFLATSPSALEALKSASLLQGLQVNALILGAKGSGKKTLATTILPDAPVLRADDFLELLEIVKESSEVIVTHFETLPNSEKLSQALQTYNTRLVATTSVELPLALYNEFFSIKIDLPDLSDRKEDIKPLCQKFLSEFSDIIGDLPDDFCDEIPLDLSENAHSLKRSIIMNALYDSVSERELMNITENFFRKNLQTENAYRDSLHLFDIPIIKAGLQQHKSQLKLSEVLGINRNTLRKKILQFKEELDNE